MYIHNEEAARGSRFFVETDTEVSVSWACPRACFSGFLQLIHAAQRDCLLADGTAKIEIATTPQRHMFFQTFPNPSGNDCLEECRQ